MSVQRFGSKEAECYYVDINLSNGDGSVALPLNKYVNKGVICIDPSDYYVAVNRLQLPSTGWLWTPILATTGQTTPPVKTQYKITMSTTLGAGFTSDPFPIELIRSDFTVSVPTVVAGNLVNGQPQNSYAAVYEYSTLERMIQLAITQAFIDLQTKAGASLPSNVQAPLIKYNPDSGRFTISCYPYSVYYNDSVQLWFSSNYRPYLKGWPLEIFSENSSNGKDIKLMLNRGITFYDQDGATPPQWFAGPPGETTSIGQPVDPTTAVLVCQQSYAASFVFNSITSVQIVCDLPIIQENTDPILQASINGGQQYNFQSILTDFIIDGSGTSNGFSQPLVYNANGIDQSRIIKLLGRAAIQGFNIAAYFIDSNGVQHPITSIGGSQPASIKLAFYHRKLIERQDLSGPITH